MKGTGRIGMSGPVSTGRVLPVCIAAFSLACGPPREVLRIGAGGAVHPEPSAEETGLDPAAPHAWLWRVSGGDAVAPSYMLGTMHLGVTFREAVPEPLDATLFDARAVVMEVDVREAERFFASAPASPRPRGFQYG